MAACRNPIRELQTSNMSHLRLQCWPQYAIGVGYTVETIIGG